MYRIDLTKFNPDLFYDKIVEIVSKNLGWVNFQKAIFEHVEERDYCLLELEKQLGIKGSEINEFAGEAKALYIALKQIYPDIKLSKDQEKELNKSFIELLMLNSDEIFHLLKISKEELSKFQELRKYEKLEVSNKFQ
ncbi:MAG: hypothetical protein ACFFCE_00210 [Promethearchaeota archaeon]